MSVAVAHLWNSTSNQTMLVVLVFNAQNVKSQIVSYVICKGLTPQALSISVVTALETEDLMISVVSRTLISIEDLSVQLRKSVFFQPGLKASAFQEWHPWR